MLVVDPSLLAEYLPPQRRGRFLAFLDFFWPFGLLIATGLSWIFLDQLDGEWRWLFVAAAFPALFAYVVRRTLPESPYFLARRGRVDEAAAVLGEITGQPVEPESLEPVQETRSSRARARRGPASLDLRDRRPRLDRAQHLVLRALPLVAGRCSARKGSTT